MPFSPAFPGRGTAQRGLVGAVLALAIAFNPVPSTPGPDPSTPVPESSTPGPFVPVPNGIGQCVAPEVSGLPVEQARAMLTGLPKNTITVTQTPSDPPTSQTSYVVDYQISECSTDYPYQAYTITLELGTKVPALRDLPRDDAETVLADFGFTADARPPDAGVEWTVTGQDPAAGTLALYRSAVRFDLVSPTTPTPEITTPTPEITTPAPEVVTPEPSVSEPGDDTGPVDIPITDTGGSTSGGTGPVTAAVLGGLLIGLVLIARGVLARRRTPQPVTGPPPPRPVPPPAPRPASHAQSERPHSAIHCVAHPDPAPHVELHLTASATPLGGRTGRPAGPRIPDIRVELHADAGRQELREVAP
ncbi:hypothetical protein [Sphaerisporangium corydalis]|uniref:Uncharacterized protein n=1 Tax=Sphaerisporangium corydalis TaxID=1441875 RepID=A0ABV9ECP5_9ACTN|nr:hypothetical protein [Sphaerisporangium corydalis]